MIYVIKERHEIPLYKRVKWDNISEDLLAASAQIQTKIDDKTVNEMWTKFKEAMSRRLKNTN